jgi:nucleosome assembly protein 1-like 1
VNGMVQTQLQEVDAESFFTFFKAINLEDKEQIEKWLQETKLDKYAERMDIDYDIARMIIDEIIPYSLEYYLGVKINDAYDDIEEVDGESSKGSDEEDNDK